MPKEIGLFYGGTAAYVVVGAPENWIIAT